MKGAIIDESGIVSHPAARKEIDVHAEQGRVWLHGKSFASKGILHAWSTK
jgi:hypothetical protein